VPSARLPSSACSGAGSISLTRSTTPQTPHDEYALRAAGAGPRSSDTSSANHAATIAKPATITIAVTMPSACDWSSGTRGKDSCPGMSMSDKS